LDILKRPPKIETIFHFSFTLLSNAIKSGRLYQIFVAFSEYLNFDWRRSKYFYLRFWKIQTTLCSVLFVMPECIMVYWYPLIYYLQGENTQNSPWLWVIFQPSWILIQISSNYMRSIVDPKEWSDFPPGQYWKIHLFFRGKHVHTRYVYLCA
jgi:hypothetical protein